MYEQIFTPVPWVACTNALKAEGVESLVECGPGKVLAGLCKRIDKSMTSYSSDNQDDIENAIKALNESD